MITMLGNHLCKDCVAACAEIERQHLPIEFHDMETSMEYLKEFLKVREGHPELFEECRKNNSIGIPVFVLEDGTVTFSCEEAFEAAKRIKAPVVTMVGTHLCPGCRARLEEIREEGLNVEFHDILENLQDMRLFLKIREGHPEIYDEIRNVGRVGVPVFILPDGTVTIDGDLAMDEMRKLK
ncbi:MAG: hypothetical protein IJ374_07345 [Lachnospiraceae bacterium]|nr:hypothetical protein [Lachnospiraceae bacterium]